MLTFFVVLACVLHIRAIGQAPCVSFSSTSSSFPVVSANKAAPIYLSNEDWAGVHRAASDFAADIQRVTNIKPTITNITSQGAPNSTVLPILVGTLGKSSLIDNVVNNTSLDVSTVRGKWESFITQVVSNPLPGVSRAYVIIGQLPSSSQLRGIIEGECTGSDKRGTIYALYELSEQFGAFNYRNRDVWVNFVCQVFLRGIGENFLLELMETSWSYLAGGLMSTSKSGACSISPHLVALMVLQPSSTEASSSTMSSLHFKIGQWQSSPMVRLPVHLTHRSTIFFTPMCKSSIPQNRNPHLVSASSFCYD